MVAARRGCGPHDEVKQTSGDFVGIEVTMESLGCRPGGLQTLRLGVEKIHHFRRRPDRIVERPIPPFDAVVEELWNWPEVSRHDGKAGRHRFDDR